MWHRYACLIVAANVAGAATASAASPDTPCGKHDAGAAGNVALPAMSIKTALYGVAVSGRLLKVDLDGGKTTILSDHGFESMPSLRASADGRWLSYSGVLKTGNKTQYWLYDRRRHSEQLVYEHPAWGGGIPAFSPDSRYLAIGAAYDSRWGGASGDGLFLFDTQTSRLLPVKLPPGISGRQAWPSTSWSRDGTLLLLARGLLPDARFSYVGYHPASTRSSMLSGQYDAQEHRYTFKRGNKTIPAADEGVPRSDIAHESGWSPGRQWHAYFDQRQDSRPYQLLVADKAGAIRPVAVGGYSQCEGYTLNIIGWFDERHLLYRSGMTTYRVFDAETGNTADLPGEDDMPLSFTW
ncbi:WD40 repeat domain-containing protein [Massilia sp. CCM 8734]|uniref:TolB family protein n=1 Tax=Massilia sp. CCM 8734 TaxID=2609283 RepID=UPI0014213542|nr:WD40 repeat domain-containing protein [Massilia sp. CCM 8734]NHZ94660.1 hypothetical protein [Massilia sp. CCM 8734]